MEATSGYKLNLIGDRMLLKLKDSALAQADRKIMFVNGKGFACLNHDYDGFAIGWVNENNEAQVALKFNHNREHTIMALSSDFPDVGFEGNQIGLGLKDQKFVLYKRIAPNDPIFSISVQNEIQYIESTMQDIRLYSHNNCEVGLTNGVVTFTNRTTGENVTWFRSYYGVQEEVQMLNQQ
jgi:hypothetical protein